MKPKIDKWPAGFSITVGSRWRHRELEETVGELFAADVDENEIKLEVFQSGMRRTNLAWCGTAQELQADWLLLPNDKAEARPAGALPPATG